MSETASTTIHCECGKVHEVTLDLFCPDHLEECLCGRYYMLHVQQDFDLDPDCVSMSQEESYSVLAVKVPTENVDHMLEVDATLFAVNLDDYTEGNKTIANNVNTDETKDPEFIAKKKAEMLSIKMKALRVFIAGSDEEGKMSRDASIKCDALMEQWVAIEAMGIYNSCTCCNEEKESVDFAPRSPHPLLCQDCCEKLKMC